MKTVKQWFKQKKVQVIVAMTTFAVLYLPKIAYADARSDAQAKLKNDFSGAVNGFTGVFQFLAYGVAVLAIIISGIGAMFIHDEQSIKQMKKNFYVDYCHCLNCGCRCDNRYARYKQNVVIAYG